MNPLESIGDSDQQLAEVGTAWERQYSWDPQGLEQPEPNQPIQIWYHGENCRDGFGAAYAAWKLWGDRPTYVPLEDRINPPPHTAADAIYILDFSFKERATMVQLEKEVAYLLVIDHHASAQRELEGLPFAIFDMEHSGAVLAWQHFHPRQPVPELLRYIEDRDLWLWELPDSREVNWALRSYPLGDFELWDSFTISGLTQDGVPIRRFVEQTIREDALGKAFEVDIGGQTFAVVNSPIFRSEIPDALRERGSPASATYADGPGGRGWSLRSDGTVDVSRIAEKLGGGGHAQSAGFREEKPGSKVKIKWPVKAVDLEP